MIHNLIEFRRELEKVNEWWLSGSVKEAERYPFKRELFLNLQDELKTRRIIILLGPRRVGKSILLKQMIDSLIKSDISPSSILYYSLDDPALFTYSDNVVKDIIDYYQENIAQGERKYIFLDEVHSYRDWYKWIKSYYDRYPDLKFILSGSSSLALQRDANRYLRGRTLEVELYPLSLREFFELSGVDVPSVALTGKGKSDKLIVDKLGYKIKDYFNEYLLVGGFPEWFEVKKLDTPVNRWFSRLINDIPKKAIYEDVVNLYGVKNPRILELIFTFIAANQSKILAYETINEIARLDRSTLVNYLEFLKVSYLVVEILKFARLKEQMKAKKKFLIIDQGLRNAVLKDYQIREENIGFIIENLVGLKCFLQAKKEDAQVFYWKIDDEIDFIMKDRDILPVEVKYKAQISSKEIKGLLKFMEKRKIDKGMVVTKDLYDKKRFEGKEISFIPMWLFLLD